MVFACMPEPHLLQRQSVGLAATQAQLRLGLFLACQVVLSLQHVPQVTGHMSHACMPEPHLSHLHAAPWATQSQLRLGLFVMYHVSLSTQLVGAGVGEGHVPHCTGHASLACTPEPHLRHLLTGRLPTHAQSLDDPLFVCQVSESEQI